MQEPKMAPVCMEIVWETRLLRSGWSTRAARQVALSLATSTRQLYNRLLGKLRDLCYRKMVMFPPTEDAPSIIADFLCQIADSSDKPASQLRSAAAAITWMYHCIDEPCPMNSFELSSLTSALIKSGTLQPSLRTKIMPCEPFTQLFEQWGANEKLSVKQLRLKSITLLALACMTRPSDLAPNGEVFDPLSLTTSKMEFTTNQLQFHNDGSLTIVFFGIKNDADRKGFEVCIPPGASNASNPVQCLRDYVSRTDSQRPDSKPVFISLNAPFKGICSGTVSNILKEAIALAGLSDSEYTPRSFRPTGATAAIEAGCLPETAMQIGRWKTKEVFLNRYVYPKAPQNYTENVMKFSGLH